MRPLIALLTAAAILLSVHFYLQFAASLRGGHVEAVADVAATGIYSADVTLTFDAQADEFSLEPVSLVLRQQQRVLLKREDLVPAGEPLVVPNIPGVLVGDNEFYFESVPKNEGAPVARAVRVRLFRDGTLVAEQTLWSEPGQVPRGPILLHVEAPKAKKHDHKH
jgi:hypothetical protein